MGTQESHIRELLVWIEDNLTKPLSLDIVSAKSGYTKWYLQRMFKKQTGLSLASYIRARRLCLAAFALRFTQKSILDISIQYQFDNQQTFSRCFKKHFAESPSVYRHARKQDFSHLVRSLSANQPGDIQVDRVSIAPGQYVLKGKCYSYHLDVANLGKSHMPIRSAFREEFYAHIGGRPELTYALTHLMPDGERVRIDYSLGVAADWPSDNGINLEPLPDIDGEFCRFCYSGKPVALNDHLLHIYTQTLPELGLARREGPDLTMFSYRLNEREELHIELQHLVPVTPLG
ncbi:Right origin-binding protein [Serratia entomophila]|jgi:AraC family transcriptional activator of mar-sox-rob regulon|uniref:Helix-turn-helix domain-containing protein n=1 Tax=Serratia entomophila TaxID=42906 RepID=A0ABY5CSH6_9GAMM|nr:helix-turn-helix domain-containing protein [Serratia entomophila]UIW17713.1 helix-turn-helix domain-containing protein [Serratia entomophila]USV00272.1 helix-turn-helix domain-containing protein [Serratia entomophila]CAI0977847.1 Right origin-binding protein [Serratia entomophila]CAI0978707.1 Right origin-binding protein [Serratia entomophila]CAI0992513.1 Right origin-binding protein [Serratia entomophila]